MLAKKEGPNFWSTSVHTTSPPASSLRLSVTICAFRPDYPWDGDNPTNVTGKLPGLYGGSLISGGGITSDGTNGISTRYQWRENGQGEVKAYIPNEPDNSFAPAFGRSNSDFQFKDDYKWQNITQLITLNSVVGDQVYANGIMQVWLDGNLVIDESDLIYRTVDTLAIEGLFFSTFFGGSGDDWATPVDTTVDFRNIVVTTLPVPEPGAASLLLLTASAGLFLRTRRTR